MTATTSAIKVAFIGMGPRGLGALEALVKSCASSGRPIEINIFDELDLGGAGPNFDPVQSSLGLLNTPLRDVELKPVLDLPCGGFQDWLKGQGQPDGDHFAPRSELGSYLQRRLYDVMDSYAANLTVTFHKAHVTSLHQDGAAWMVSTENDDYGPFDEVLLVLGQPRTATDKQWAAWIDHAQHSDAYCMQAYPDRHVLAAAKGWTNRNVGIRGLGLSTFDVLRYLTVGQGGTFKNGTYQKSGAEPARIFAFSLNGQPPFPKPVDAAHDDHFTLTKPEAEQFVVALHHALTHGPERALDLICGVLVGPVARIGSNLGADFDSADVREWLEIERSSAGDQETGDPVATLKQGIGMADGAVPPTVGYVIGQIWRKLQNELRVGFNSAPASAETAKAIVNFDEGLKRYSYGPPLSSARELLALIECGQVSLAVVDDPSISLIKDGWRLSDDAQATVSVMINAVLPPPSLAKITDPLIAQLRSQSLLCQLYEGSGAKTLPDGQIMNSDGDCSKGLSLLGRLALGSVIAVDSVHDCFGASTVRWAQGVIHRRQAP